jgi:succinate dehydrogenase/fumarate reductase cytochrome b subunit
VVCAVPRQATEVSYTSRRAKVSAKVTLGLPFWYHSFNGIRHLSWDLGKGGERRRFQVVLMCRLLPQLSSCGRLTLLATPFWGLPPLLPSLPP